MDSFADMVLAAHVGPTLRMSGVSAPALSVKENL